MKTKHLVRFYNRIAHFDADLELADVVKINITAGNLHANDNTRLFYGVSEKQHPRLSARKINAANRSATVHHLKATLYASFLKDIYEDFTIYLLSLLTSAARSGLDPNRLIGEHKVTFTGNDVLEAGSWPKVVEMVSNDLFRRLENERSTKSLVEKTNIKLNLGVSDETIDAALPFFELRHLLVHTDGFPDKRFCDAFPEIAPVQGKRVKLDYELAQLGRTAIVDLVEEFDRCAVKNGIVARSELQG